MVSRWLNVDAHARYLPTMGVEIHPIRRGDRTYNIWDCGGDPRFVGMGDGYFTGTSGAIIMSRDPMMAAHYEDMFRRVNQGPVITIHGHIGPDILDQFNL